MSHASRKILSGVGGELDGVQLSVLPGLSKTQGELRSVPGSTIMDSH